MRGQSGDLHRQLLDLIHDMSLAPDLEGALSALLKSLGVLLPSDGASIMWLDEDHLEVLASSGQSAPLPGLALPVGQMGAARLLVDGGRPVLIADVAEDSRWQPVPGEERVRCWLAVPLLVDARPAGLLEWTSLQPEWFCAEDVEVGIEIADYSAPVLHRARLQEDMRVRLRELVDPPPGLGGVAADLGRELQPIVKDAQEFTLARQAFIFVTDENGPGMRCVAAAGEGRQHLKGVTIRGDGTLSGWPVLPMRGTGRLGSGRSDREVLARLGIRTALVLPLSVSRQPMGVLGIAEPARGRGFDQECMRTMTHLASQASLILERSFRPQMEADRWDYATVVQSSPLGVAVLSRSGDIRLCNPAFVRLVSHSQRSLAGRNLTEFLAPEDGQRLRQALEQVSNSRQQRQLEPGVRSDLGERRFVRLWLSLVRTADDLSGNVVVIGEDVTSLKILEQERVRHLSELKELDQLKSCFVSNVSHELRTPLAVIKLYAALARKGRPDKQGHYLQTIEQEIHGLETLVENILSQTRLDRQALESHPEWLATETVIGEVVERSQEAARRKEIDLHNQVHPPLPPVWADRNHLARMLTNLLDNAVKYTPRGGRVWVTAQEVNGESNAMLEVSVSDTGPGIPNVEHEKVFERFYRGRSSAPESTGTGLGLAIVRELMALHGGTVTLASRLGEGSTFTLHFPLVRIAEGTGMSDQAQVEGED